MLGNIVKSISAIKMCLLDFPSNNVQVVDQVDGKPDSKKGL